MNTGTLAIPLDVKGKEQLLRALAAKGVMSCAKARGKELHTGVEVLDELAPGGALAGGAVHEVLWKRSAPCPTTFALLLARAGQQAGGAIAWSDPARELYLPALAAAGIDLRRLLLLRCQNRLEQLWALAECMACRGIGATVANVNRLSQVEARRLQLAAERGGGVGILLRPWAPGNTAPYAAATRWLVQPAPGDEGSQRWQIQLLHGHGGRTGQVLLLEINRETRAVRASQVLADRPPLPAPSRATG